MSAMTSTITIFTIVLLALSCRPLKTNSDSKNVDHAASAGEYIVGYSRVVESSSFKPSVSNRQAALVMVIADSQEPELQLAVGHELLALQEACASGDSDVNWVAFVNSHLVVRKEFMVCRQGKISSVDFNVKSIIDKINFFANAKAPVSELYKGAPKELKLNPALAVSHDPAINNMYAKMPVVHPEILSDLLAYAMAAVFPATQYRHIIHLKGHGSKEFALTGYPEKVANVAMAEQLKRLQEKAFDPNTLIKYGHFGYEITNDQAKVIENLGFGQIKPKIVLNVERPGVTKLNADSTASRLNADSTASRLNADSTASRLNADSTASRLNADPSSPLLNADNLVGRLNAGEKLSPKSHYGTSVTMLPKVIAAALDKAKQVLKSKEIQIDLLTLESCESDLLYKDGVLHSGLAELMKTHLRGIYAPVGSLDYRNLDWNNIIYTWLKTEPNAKAEILFSILKIKLSEVPNYIKK